VGDGVADGLTDPEGDGDPEGSPMDLGISPEPQAAIPVPAIMSAATASEARRAERRCV
jgi:hypothetical protein